MVLVTKLVLVLITPFSHGRILTWIMMKSRSLRRRFLEIWSFKKNLETNLSKKPWDKLIKKTLRQKNQRNFSELSFFRSPKKPWDKNIKEISRNFLFLRPPKKPWDKNIKELSRNFLFLRSPKNLETKISKKFLGTFQPQKTLRQKNQRSEGLIILSQGLNTPP